MSSKIEVSRESLEAWAERFSKAQMFKESSEVRALIDLDKGNSREMGLMQFVDKHAATVVERQEPAAIVKQWTVDPWYPNPGIHKAVEVLKDLPDGTKLYTAPPELAELQATIAQQAAEIERLKGGQGDVQMAAVPVERCYDVRAKMIIAFNEARKNGGDLDDGLDAAYKSALRYSPSSLDASQPAPVSVAQHPFADKVISKLWRFRSCAEDGQGADIGRHWFDLLTQLGLLNRVQRSPALWEITQQGEDCLDKVKELNQ